MQMFQNVYLQKPNQMKLSDFNYDLPKNLLAEFPSENRDESRLMVIDRKTEKIEHYQFKDLINYFEEEDVLIINNTKAQSCESL